MAPFLLAALRPALPSLLSSSLWLNGITRNPKPWRHWGGGLGELHIILPVLHPKVPAANHPMLLTGQILGERVSSFHHFLPQNSSL